MGRFRGKLRRLSLCVCGKIGVYTTWCLDVVFLHFPDIVNHVSPSVSTHGLLQHAQNKNVHVPRLLGHVQTAMPTRQGKNKQPVCPYVSAFDVLFGTPRLQVRHVHDGATQNGKNMRVGWRTVQKRVRSNMWSVAVQGETAPIRPHRDKLAEHQELNWTCPSDGADRVHVMVAPRNQRNDQSEHQGRFHCALRETAF